MIRFSASIFKWSTWATLCAGEMLVLNSAGANSNVSLAVPYVHEKLGDSYADERRMFQGVPTVAISPHGRVWVAWYGGGIEEGRENFVMLATSDDMGQSWTAPVLVIDPPYRASEPMLWLDPKQRMWLVWNQYPLSLTEPGAQMWALTTSDPDSAYPRWINQGVLAQELSCMNKPTVLRDGTWVWPTGSWQYYQTPSKHSRPMFSVDRGNSFSVGGIVPIPSESREFDEYQIVEKRDGRLWLLTRTRKGIEEFISSDQGKSWNALPPSGIKHTVSRFFIGRLSSGKLLLIKNGPVNQDVGRAQLMAYLSDDDGASWFGGLLLDGREEVSYPDAVEHEGVIYVVYDRSRHVDKEILLARFRESDVSAGRIVERDSKLAVVVNRATGINEKYLPKPPEPTVHRPDAIATNFVVTGSPALVRTEKGAELVILSKSRIFNDRDYVWQDVPQTLYGKRYVQMSIEGGEVTVTKDGILSVATPRPSRNRDSIEAALVAAGFHKTNFPEFSAFDYHDRAAVACSLFQKRVIAGEKIVTGKWGIILLF